MERSTCGSGGCVTCPFSFNDLADQVQNYGCLPSAGDILKMKETTGHNWSCHGDASVLCGGYVKYIKTYRWDLDITKGGLISYETWYHEGEEAAISEANGKEIIKRT